MTPTACATCSSAIATRTVTASMTRSGACRRRWSAAAPAAHPVQGSERGGAISADGRYIAFASDAVQPDLRRHQRRSETSSCAIGCSRSSASRCNASASPSAGAQAMEVGSDRPRAERRWPLRGRSNPSATNLVANDTNGVRDIFVARSHHDRRRPRESRVRRLASRPSDRQLRCGAVSGNGERVVYTSSGCACAGRIRTASPISTAVRSARARLAATASASTVSKRTAAAAARDQRGRDSSWRSRRMRRILSSAGHQFRRRCLRPRPRRQEPCGWPACPSGDDGDPGLRCDAQRQRPHDRLFD